MAPAGHRGDDVDLFETVKAVSLEFCPQIGVSIPVGKDSLSMRTTWKENGAERQVIAPLSLIISAFAPVPGRAPQRDAPACRATRAWKPICC